MTELLAHVLDFLLTEGIAASRKEIRYGRIYLTLLF